MKKIFILQTFILISLILFIQSCSINPVTGERQFTLISKSQEVAMGEQQYPIMTQISGGLLQDKELQDYVNTIGQNLAEISHRPDLEYEFNVVNSSELNAYALPGGKISITRGLLSQMNNEAQLAAVLGHEIGHVTAKHIATQITRQITAQLVITGVSAYLEQKDIKHHEYYTLGGILAAQLMMLKFSREQESQADKLGIEYIKKVGYETEGFVEMLEILRSAQSREPTEIEGFLSSHPLTRDRISDAKAQIDQSATGEKDKEEFELKTKVLERLEPAYKHYDTAEKFMVENKVQQAIDEYNQAIKIAPDQAIFYSDLSFAYFKANQINKAKRNIDKSLQIYPELFQSRFYSGLINLKLDNYRNSLTDFEKADKLIPNQPSVQFYQGLCNENLSRKEKAIQNYKQVLNLTTEGDYAKKAQKRLKALGYDFNEFEKEEDDKN